MKNASIIQEIVQISRDGLEFYEHAASEVKSDRLKGVFGRMAGHKRQLISALSTDLSIRNEDVPTDGTIAGSIRKGYADVRAALSSNEDKVYVAQLEETEDRLLEHFNDAIANCDDPTVKALLQKYYPQVRACHDEMRSLKLQYAA